MIPPFDKSGCLPPGVHPARLDEIDSRFGSISEVRRVQMDSVRWMVDLARRAGITRVLLNGSFVTDIMEPNDVDCVLLVGKEYPQDAEAADAIENGLPFLEIAVVSADPFNHLVNEFFATDRFGNPKGMVEIIQWN